MRHAPLWERRRGESPAAWSHGVISSASCGRISSAKVKKSFANNVFCIDGSRGATHLHRMKDSLRMHPAVRIAHRIDAAVEEIRAWSMGPWLVPSLMGAALVMAVWGWLGL